MSDAITESAPAESTGKKSYVRLNEEYFLRTIKSKTAPFLHGEKVKDDVVISPKGIKTLSTGKNLKGSNLLLAQNFAQDIKLYGNELCSESSLKKAGNYNEKAPFLALSIKDKETGEYKTVKYYSPAASYNREGLKTQRPPAKSIYYDGAKKDKGDLVVEAKGVTADEYMGKWLAATQAANEGYNAKFVTNYETINAVADELKKNISETMEQGKFNELNQIGFRASEKCKEYCKEMFPSRDNTRTAEREQVKQQEQEVTMVF